METLSCLRTYSLDDGITVLRIVFLNKCIVALINPSSIKQAKADVQNDGTNKHVCCEFDVAQIASKRLLDVFFCLKNSMARRYCRTPKMITTRTVCPRDDLRPLDVLKTQQCRCAH